ncbi:DNA methyltransferase [Lactiplantibacillus pentosus]|uniref:DNA methyltransferase n=1 Tax=Lactiplantibacillus pentosus TaxID=1589 RepID=UPI0031F17BCA
MENGPQSEEAHYQVLESEKSLKNLRVQDIKFIDPAMGSGHILVYAFEVLMDIYLSEGFSKREAAEQIMNNNVHGLDIDTRAFQLSYFAVMMKARQYNRRILNTEHSLNVLCIPDTQDLNLENFDPLFERLTEGSSAMLKKLIVDFQHGDEFGSLITEERNDFSALISELDQLNQNPTLNFQPSDIGSLPVISQKDGRAENVVRENINIARIDWDKFENSWNFKSHPLLSHIADDKQKEIDGRLENAFAVWKDEAQERFEKLKANEEELNRIFIDLYGLNDELTPEVADKNVSVRRADEERDIKSLLSYFVGLVFGRYSLDIPGLAYAGGDWSSDKYQSFVPNKDNLLLLNDDRYFDDERDIMNRFKSFLAVTFGDKHVQENMDYIARIIGKKADNSEQAIRKYFVDDFFKDHKKGYQKRPIYWEFSSGKQDGFKALMYLHRYDEGELAMIRTDYLYPLQSRYEERIERLEQWVQDESVAKTKKQLEKNLKHVTQQLKELKQYDPILRHVADERIKLDLDDGVLVNYDKLQDGSKILTKL